MRDTRTPATTLAVSVFALLTIVAGCRDTTTPGDTSVGSDTNAVAAVELTPTNIKIHGVHDSARVLVRLRTASGRVLRDRLPSLLDSSATIAPLGALEAASDASYSAEFWVRTGALGHDQIVVMSGGKQASLGVTVGIAGDDSIQVRSGAARDLGVLDNDLFSPGIPVRPDARVTITQPQHGVAEYLSSRVLRYTSTPGFVGRDSLQYVVADPKTGVLDTGIVRYNVSPGLWVVTPIISSGNGVTVTDINTPGRVSGYITRPNGVRRAFRWVDGGMQLLDSVVPNATVTWTTALAINTAGDVVGSVSAPSEWAALWRAGSTAVELPVGRQDLQAAAAINDRGQIVIRGFLDKTLLITGTRVDTIDPGIPPNEPTSCFVPRAINNSGDILFTAACSVHWKRRTAAGAFVIPAGCPASLFATAMNDSGTVVSNGFTGGNPCITPASGRGVRADSVYDRRVFSLSDINNSGWIVGALMDGGVSVPVLLIGGATIRPEISRLSGGWTVEQFVAINDRGQILGYGTDPVTGLRTAVVLSYRTDIGI